MEGKTGYRSVLRHLSFTSLTTPPGLYSVKDMHRFDKVTGTRLGNTNPGSTLEGLLAVYTFFVFRSYRM